MRAMQLVHKLRLVVQPDQLLLLSLLVHLDLLLTSFTTRSAALATGSVRTITGPGGYESASGAEPLPGTGYALYIIEYIAFAIGGSE